VPDPPRARLRWVEILNEFSAHADARELVESASEMEQKGSLKQIFIVHGEEAQSLALAERLREKINVRITVPYPGDVFDIH